MEKTSQKREIEQSLYKEHGILHFRTAKKSIPLLKKVAGEDLKKTMPLILRGNIFRSQDNFENAIDFHQKPKVPLPRFLLGEAYIRLEMFDDAMSEFQKAYAFNPDSVALNLLIGKIYERKDDFLSASTEYQKAFQKELASVLKFTGGKCGYQISKWVGRCPESKEWDINSFDMHKPEQNYWIKLPAQLLPLPAVQP